MKKTVSAILLCLLVMVLSVTAFAADNAKIEFITYESDDGERTYVDVTITENEASMLQFCVDYDSEKLECVSATAGGVFSGKNAPLINKTEGKIYFIWDSLTPLKDSGTLLHIEFIKKNDSGSEVGVDEEESFIVANSKFETVGEAGESAKIEGKQEENVSSESSSSDQSSVSSESSPESSSSVQNSSSASSSVSSSSQSSSSASSVPKPEIETGSNNGITVDKNDAVVDVEDEIEIEIIEGEKENVIWYSSNEDVAKVEDGKVVPVSPGTAIITVTTEDGTEEATCVVTVTEEETKTESSGSEEEAVEVLSSGEKEKTPAYWLIIVIPLVAAVIMAAVLIIKKSKKQV